MRTVTIATKHSEHNPAKDEMLEIQLQGGSPYFVYLWIDDELYSLTQSTGLTKVFLLKRIR